MINLVDTSNINDAIMCKELELRTLIYLKKIMERLDGKRRDKETN